MFVKLHSVKDSSLPKQYCGMLVNSELIVMLFNFLHVLKQPSPRLVILSKFIDSSFVQLANASELRLVIVLGNLIDVSYVHPENS